MRSKAGSGLKLRQQPIEALRGDRTERAQLLGVQRQAVLLDAPAQGVEPRRLGRGPLAGLVAVCAGSDVMHPLGALITGAVAGGLFVVLFTLTQNRWKIDDVLGVWPLHGMCGAWGGIAAGIFGAKALGGIGGVALGAQLAGTALAIAIALVGAVLVYGALKATIGLRLDAEEEFNGADLSIHRITATPEREPAW